MNADGGLYIEDDGYGKNTAEIALQKVIDNGEALRVEYVSIDGACTDAAPKQIPEFENLIAIDLCISRLWAVDAYDFPPRIEVINLRGSWNVDSKSLIRDASQLPHLRSIILSSHVYGEIDALNLEAGQLVQ